MTRRSGRWPSRLTASAWCRRATPRCACGMSKAARAWPSCGTKAATSRARSSRPTARRSPWRRRARAGSGYGISRRRRSSGEVAADVDVVWSVAFSPDGRELATASSNEVVELWDLATGEERGALTGHTGGATDLAFLADGVTLAAVDRSGRLHLWDARQRSAVDRGLARPRRRELADRRASRWRALRHHRRRWRGDRAGNR